ncbi:LOW QUALITY PROTEIN: growth-regulated alpha protein-like [Leptosomus discolor]
MDGKSVAAACVLHLVLMAGSMNKYTYADASGLCYVNADFLQEMCIFDKRSFRSKALAKPEEKGFQCLCISTHSEFITLKAIQNVRLSQRGPHCKNVEIISTLKVGRVCLEPTAPWVQLTGKTILAGSVVFFTRTAAVESYF